MYTALRLVHVHAYGTLISQRDTPRVVTRYVLLYLWLLGAFKETIIIDWIIGVRPQQIGAQSLGRLVGHLDAVLQHGHWKRDARVARQPETEVGVRHTRVGDDGLADTLQLRHP